MWKCDSCNNSKAAHRFSEVKEQEERRASLSVVNTTPVHILVLFTAEEPLFSFPPPDLSDI